MKTIKIYKTNIGVFAYLYGLDPIRTRINGIMIDDLVQFNQWHKIDSDIVSVERLVPPNRHQTGWRLSSPEIQSHALPLELEMSAITGENDDDDIETVIGTHAAYKSLYCPVYHTDPERWTEVAFELVQCGIGEYDVTGVDAPVKMEIKLAKERCYGNAVVIRDLSTIVTYDELAAIITPAPFIHTQPCSLSSEQVYKIVRHWVKENIDLKVAIVSSDYDFCFVVDKRVKIKAYPTIQNDFFRGKPKAKKVTKTDKLVRAFEMTWSGYDNKKNGYDGYTVIAPWQADSLQDMATGIKQYLDRLMEAINSEVAECQHCSGLGYIIQSFPTNAP